jgi:hypothetical protein
MPKKKIVKKKEQEVMYITEVPLSIAEKDVKKAVSILKSKEMEFGELMDKLKKENVNIRSIGCSQIMRNVIHNLNLPINMVIAEIERIKFDLMNPANFNQPQLNNGKDLPAYLG